MKYRILVVEDNPLNLELLCAWLETEGYEVLSAADLKSAFASLQNMKPHAVLLDIQLGDDDGLSLAAWIREQPDLCHIPVIAVTAHALVGEREQILQSGCTAFIPKPVNFNLLQEHLDRWLTRSEMPPSAD